MRNTLMLVRIIPFILLLASTCVGQSTMVEEDFSSQGVSIVLPTDPSYGDELQKLGLSPSSSRRQPPPFSVLLKNESGREIAALGIRFTKRFANGYTATSDVMANKPSALLDSAEPGPDRPVEGLATPGASLLISPDGIVEVGRKANAKHQATVIIMA